MTWKEFKEQVDKQLVEKGADESIELQYIDVGFFNRGVDVNVERVEGEDDRALLSISD